MYLAEEVPLNRTHVVHVVVTVAQVDEHALRPSARTAPTALQVRCSRDLEMAGVLGGVDDGGWW